MKKLSHFSIFCLFIGFALFPSAASANTMEELQKLSRLVATQPNEEMVDPEKERVFSPSEKEKIEKPGHISGVDLGLLKRVLQYKNFVLVSAGPNPEWEKGLKATDEKIVARTHEFKDVLEKNGLSFLEIEGNYSGTQEDSFLVVLSDEPKERKKQLALIEDRATAMKQDSIIMTYKPGLYGLKFLQDYNKTADGKPIEDKPRDEEKNLAGKFYPGVSFATFDREPEADYTKFKLDKSKGSSENIFFAINLFFDLGLQTSYEEFAKKLKDMNETEHHSFSVVDKSKAAVLKSSGLGEKKILPASKASDHRRLVETQTHSQSLRKPLFVVTRGTDGMNELGNRLASKLKGVCNPDDIVLIGTDPHIAQTNKELDELYSPGHEHEKAAFVETMGLSNSERSNREIWPRYQRGEFTRRNRMQIEEAMKSGKQCVVYVDMNKNKDFIPADIAEFYGYHTVAVRWQDTPSLGSLNHLLFMNRHCEDLRSVGDFEAPMLNVGLEVEGTEKKLSVNIPQIDEAEFDRRIKNLKNF